MRLLVSVIRFGFVPVFALTFGYAALQGIAAGWGFGRLAILLLAAIATSFAAERIAPYESSWNESHGDRLRDVLHLVVNESLIVASISSLPPVTHALGTDSRGYWPEQLPFTIQVLISLLVFDLGITFAHAASHRVSLLWRFHAVHHSVERMYGMNGILKHPVHQAIEMTAGTLPLVLLGLPQDVAIALACLTALQLLLQHSNVDVNTGPFRRWHAGAELHRLHHRKEPGRGDVNFGLFTTLGDRILGTLDDDLEERLGPGDLGIGAQPDYPVAWTEQMVQPFRLKRPRHTREQLRRASILGLMVAPPL